MPTEQTSQTNQQDLSKQLSLRRLVLPVFIGLLAAGWLLYRALNEVKFVQAAAGDDAAWVWTDGNGNGVVDVSDPLDFSQSPSGTYHRKTSLQLLGEQSFDQTAVIALLCALLMVFIRDFGYMYRMRVLTGGELSWLQSFQVVMLWEFSSALTPSVVGGSGVAIFILNREGVNLGRSTATIFVTAMMDEVFYILSVPLVLLLIPMDRLFPGEWAADAFGVEAIRPLFYAGYSFIVALTVIIILSIFLFPTLFKRLLMRLFSWRPLRRWRRWITNTGQEIELASAELKGRPISYWIKAFVPTVLAWTARFLTLNFIILAFVHPIDQVVVFGRQLVMWVIMLISPTPGSSGVAEYFFSVFFQDIVSLGSQVLLIALIWRFLTYFLYLILGVIVLPRWFRRTSRRIVS